MSFKLASLSSLLAACGVWFATQADQAPDSARLAELEAGQACGIDVSETEDGLLLTAWSAAEISDSWRMVVTQSAGAGGFDIVQSGEVDGNGPGAVVVSDMLVDTGAEFSARLTTWNAAGETVCRYGGSAI
ncbi:curli-like amyloid fiber formation chaperone CsgH [Maricaulis sp.]|uniref:curli-like amyloid fiber formation chaperone CsgH n=1 Tax=Maricaulis sp. TaxID=1486257 RepID=UPI0026356EF1|nr:curli-like amyloid fiber formation chaperone CsgH [Maricaulis sp.]